LLLGVGEKMSEEIEEVKKITKDYLSKLDINEFRIIFANKNSKWKVVVKYPTPDSPENTSMLMIDLDTKKVDTFREGLLPY